MAKLALSLLLFIFPLTFTVILVSTANSNVYVQCSQLNFTSTTPYESNLNSLFASLDESASDYKFNKFQISQPNDDTVYGLFQCGGDITSPNCKDCVANAVNQLKTTCPMSLGGQIQLEACFMKYDNKALFGAQGKMEASKSCGPSIGYNSDVLKRIDGALANLVGGNGQYFRSGEFGNVRGVAQCVQDLSLSDCEECLSEASRRLRSECETSAEGEMYLGKCYIRYAANQGNETLAKTSCGGESKLNTATWIVISVLSAIAGAGAGVGLTIKFDFKNCCNTSIRNTTIYHLRRDLDDAKKDAKSARERAEKAEKELEDEKKKRHESIICMPYGPPMPPPCPYLPH